MPLLKVISGGQTGADRAALKAARAVGLQTGGWMPRGFYAKDGYHPDFATLYGMQETVEETYPPRTALNVRDSDGTVRFAGNWETRGEKLTYRLIQQYKKEEIPLTVGIAVQSQVDTLVSWLIKHNIQTLNVAGNSEDSWPGIELSVECYLIEVFEKMKSEDLLVRVDST